MYESHEIQEIPKFVCSSPEKVKLTMFYSKHITVEADKHIKAPKSRLESRSNFRFYLVRHLSFNITVSRPINT